MTIAISGTNGITLDGQFNSASSMGFKNRIINGGMRVSQRGTVSVSAGSPAYTLDRWRINPTGASTSVTQGSVGYGNQTYALQLNGATSLTNVEVQQRIEQANCYDLVSTNVTVSFWMYTNKSTGVSGAQLSLVAPSAADNWSSQISGSATTYTIPSFAQNTATFVSYTFSTNANVANGLGILINTNTATASGDWIQITGVQLEKGSTATSFDYRPYGTELGLCLRYYQAYTVLVNPNITWTSWTYVAPMRANPTVSGGGSGFTIDTASVYVGNFYQTSRATQALILSAEL